jgi:hypothetical protein
LPKAKFRSPLVSRRECFRPRRGVFFFQRKKHRQKEGKHKFLPLEEKEEKQGKEKLFLPSFCLLFLPVLLFSFFNKA